MQYLSAHGDIIGSGAGSKAARRQCASCKCWSFGCRDHAPYYRRARGGGGRGNGNCTAD